MFEILMFLFENYMGNNNITLNTTNENIVLELESIGFDRFEIDRALDWLNGLNEVQETVQSKKLSHLSIRHYLPEEKERLGVEGQGLLFHLEAVNVIDPVTREIVIDRIMALEPFEVNYGRIRWVILMALFNQPNKRNALSLLQDMILADAFDKLH